MACSGYIIGGKDASRLCMESPSLYRGDVMKKPDEPKLVSAPEDLNQVFRVSEALLGPFFATLERKPEKGEIRIEETRYLLVRADSVTIELHEELRKNFGDAGAWRIAYRFGRALGKRDARMLHERFQVDDPLTKLALGPVHFAHTGWGAVEILPESRPSSNEDYLLIYRHPNSFEATSFLEQGLKSEVPVCHMNAGYSCGWCEVSFGVELVAEEITCRAAGDPHCMFIMAHPRHVKRLRDDFLGRSQAQ